MYVYQQTEPNLWTVGFHTPNGEWITGSDHTLQEKAAKRAHYLNGGDGNAGDDLCPKLEQASK